MGYLRVFILYSIFFIVNIPKIDIIKLLAIIEKTVIRIA